MPRLHAFKLTGRIDTYVEGTATGLIGTASVNYNDDGSIDFLSAAGRKTIIQPSANLNKLLKVIFSGAGGFAAGKNLIGA